MIRFPLAAAAVALLALAACQQPAAVNEGDPADGNGDATNSIALPSSDDAATPAANVINEADDAGSEDPNQAFFPAQYRGRWGMVAEDCTTTRGDAKGLITIGDTTVKFYESIANLKQQRPAIATSFAGLFAFTGEGQAWEKVMIFTRTGNTLKRADQDGGNYTYTRC